MTTPITVVILAAGIGSRMKSSRAKVLHQAAGDTLLNHVLRCALTVAAPEQVVVVIGHQAAQVRQSVEIPGVRFVEQKEQKGTGHALLCARELLGKETGTLLILNGDGPLITPATAAALVALQEQKRGGGAIVTVRVSDPTGYGRIVRDAAGNVGAIIEQKSATPEQLLIQEINPGLYAFDSEQFWRYIDEVQPNNNAGEYYLTDMIAILTGHGYPVTPLLTYDETELLGINTRAELAVADKILRTRKNRELMLSGVTMEQPDSALIDVHVQVGPDTTIGANVQLRGMTVVGESCRIDAGCILLNCGVDDNVHLQPYVVAQDTHIGANSIVGPFARMRMNSRVAAGVHIGNFVELKNTAMARGAKANHLAYLGDAAIGSETNVGAGTITCNYDGVNKHRTEIGSNVFVGSNSTLIAPLNIGSGAYVAAGSVIDSNVEPDALAIARERQTTKPGWAKRRREALVKS